MEMKMEMEKKVVASGAAHRMFYKEHLYIRDRQPVRA